jgi:hypothetical protein
MVQPQKAGDKLFIDYSGDRPAYVNRQTGELIAAELFVGTLGASNYYYLEATASQGAADFVASHMRAFAYLGGVPCATVPDNLKSGVTRSDRYAPTISPLNATLPEHDGFAVLPARVRKPRDKAKVESAVLIAQRYVLARLRNRTFFSRHELNAAIRVELDALNDEPMAGYGGQTRRERLQQLDAPALQPLPRTPFRYTAVKLPVRVGRNYHCLYDKHDYSVPYALAQQHVDLYQVGPLLEIYHDGQHVARHPVQPPTFGYATDPAHMPPNHRSVHGWSPDYFVGKGSLIGPRITKVFRRMFARYKHPEQAFKACLGVLALAKQYTPERLEAAAARALHFDSPRYRTLKAILAQGVDQQPLPGEPPVQGTLPFVHEQVRGAAYYQSPPPQKGPDHASRNHTHPTARAALDHHGRRVTTPPGTRRSAWPVRRRVRRAAHRR